MTRLEISPNFTIEDIHKIREYNYEMTKNLTREDTRKYYKEGADYARAEIERLKKKRQAVSQ